eukprot:3338073-Rhodomonas_salina.2
MEKLRYSSKLKLSAVTARKLQTLKTQNRLKVEASRYPGTVGDYIGKLTGCRDGEERVFAGLSRLLSNYHAGAQR